MEKIPDGRHAAEEREEGRLRLINSLAAVGAGKRSARVG
jgi:hypothetical protein